MIRKHFGKIRLILIISLVCILTVALRFSGSIILGDDIANRSELPADMMEPFAQEFSSHLPIMVMQTTFTALQVRTHTPTPPPGAVIWIFDNETENRLTNEPTEVFITATANYRGNSSINYPYFPKKGFKLHLYHPHLLDPLDYPVFGFAPASEWVLRTTHADKSLLRDWFSYELAATVLEWQPRGRPVHVFLQDIGGEDASIYYEGVYFFTENITVGESRLDIGQFSLEESETIDFEGGGYVVQRDRDRNNYFSLQEDVYFRYTHPGPGDMTSYEAANIRREIEFYYDFLTKSGAYEGLTGEDWDYRRYIDIYSFVDYFLLLELLMEVDAGMFSTFVYRPVGGKLVTGPFWDGDLILGNAWYRNQHYNRFVSLIQSEFIRELIRDEAFAGLFADRWNQLRSTIWSDEKLFGMFDKMAEYLAEAAVQNERRWPMLFDGETFIWPNPEPYTQSWDEEIERTRLMLEKRLSWLDDSIPRLVNESPNEINLNAGNLNN